MTTTRTTTSNLLDERQIPVQAKLAAGWISFVFLYLYVDYFHLYKPGSVDDMLDGVVFELEITPTLLTLFLASVAIPILMVTLSLALREYSLL